MYLMTIIYLFGLGTGTHLLNLLTIPFIALIIYFSINKLSLKNFILTAFVALFAFLMIQNGIIKGLPSLALQIGFYSILIIIFGIVYFNTMAPTVSFWDTGEFIATSHILGIPHPPGSPLFLLIGKFFSLIPISSDIAFRVNILSPIFSALTISLLFLICNQFIERLNNYASSDSFLRISSSFIASLTFAFTHSHWFNAVETEVYAFSCLLYTSPSPRDGLLSRMPSSA